MHEKRFEMYSIFAKGQQKYDCKFPGRPFAAVLTYRSRWIQIKPNIIIIPFRGWVRFQFCSSCYCVVDTGTSEYTAEKMELVSVNCYWRFFRSVICLLVWRASLHFVFPYVKRMNVCNLFRAQKNAVGTRRSIEKFVLWQRTLRNHSATWQADTLNFPIRTSNLDRFNRATIAWRLLSLHVNGSDGPYWHSTFVDAET